MAKKNETNTFFVLCLLYGIVSILATAFMVYQNKIGTSDLCYYWQNTAYWWRGYSLEQVKATNLELNGIGQMQGVGILSYGRALANLIVPGFLSYNLVIVYTLILNALLVILLIKNMYEYTKNLNIFTKNQGILLAILLSVFPWYWNDYVRAMNIGGTLALIAILLTFYYKKNENVSALLLALTLIKPQIGGIFFIALFIKKRYKLLVKTVGIVGVSWIIDLIYIKNQSILDSFTKIFSGYAGSGMEEERPMTWYLQYGLFNLLRRHGVSNGVVLILSAIAGIIFVVVLFNQTSNIFGLKDDSVVLFSTTAIASMFWFYKSGCDSLVLILCNLMIFLYWKYSEKKIKDYAWIAIYLIGLNCLVGRYILRFVFKFVDYDQGVFIDQVLQMVLYAIMIVKLKKNTQKTQQ